MVWWWCCAVHAGVLLYPFELWRATRQHTPIAHGHDASPPAHFRKRVTPAAPTDVGNRMVRPEVLLRDLFILPARDMRRLAHVRPRMHTHQADASARPVHRGDRVSC